MVPPHTTATPTNYIRNGSPMIAVHTSSSKSKKKSSSSSNSSKSTGKASSSSTSSTSISGILFSSTTTTSSSVLASSSSSLTSTPSKSSTSRISDSAVSNSTTSQQLLPSKPAFKSLTNTPSKNVSTNSSYVNTPSTSSSTNKFITFPTACKAVTSTTEEDEEEDSSSNRIRETIKKYNRIDNLMEMQDEGLQILRSYLQQRKNEEYLLYMEATREFKKKRQGGYSNGDDSTTPLLEEFQKIFTQFLSFDSMTCMNVPACIREQFTTVWKELNEVGHNMQATTMNSNNKAPYNENRKSGVSDNSENQAQTLSPRSNHSASPQASSPLTPMSSTSPSAIASNTSVSGSNCLSSNSISQELALKMRKCLDDLFINVQVQFKNEIMPHFKKTQEFKTFVLEKLIELSNNQQQQPQEILSPLNSPSTLSPGEVLIQDFLTQNGELAEYCKPFAKKNLTTMDQIRNFTSDDFRDKIGIKKIGHLKRIVRLTKEHFMNKSDESL
ncbi:hypothetical protein C9374_010119 [Naegleria lovaniensis]|uniref:SAM domain-containing protein n=1 Tax=Naegleria lovaniensis TaxID=51637 RepID=A0AA88GGM7_NAELO|nr:uncharacterized protein C9374_010119 [Naegleria lovaniensis]KAG2375115.1 hypothetical protein C9374_010119 [Naegleria lovaniensis]